MSRPRPLPDPLDGRAFDRAALTALRRSKGRATRKDLAHPFHGVHAAAAPTTLIELCTAYLVRMRPGQVFCHATAALLHGMPLPNRLESMQPIHVAAVRPASPPRTEGVVPHRLTVRPVLQEVAGLPVCAPSETWIQLAADLTLDECIVVADHLLTVSPLDEAATRLLLTRRIDIIRRPAARQLHAALAEARCPVLSPGETRVRLLLVRAGIPEPECNGEVFDAAGSYLGKPDLVWRAERVGLEYEGGGHADERQMQIDIERYERFKDAGWHTVRVSAADLRTSARRTALIARVWRHLEARR